MISENYWRLLVASLPTKPAAARMRLWRGAKAAGCVALIDRKAKFLWLDSPKKCPKSALGFDFDGAAFTHVGSHVTFEVLAASVFDGLYANYSRENDHE